MLATGLRWLLDNAANLKPSMPHDLVSRWLDGSFVLFVMVMGDASSVHDIRNLNKLVKNVLGIMHHRQPCHQYRCQYHDSASQLADASMQTIGVYSEVYLVYQW